MALARPEAASRSSGRPRHAARRFPRPRRRRFGLRADHRARCSFLTCSPRGLRLSFRPVGAKDRARPAAPGSPQGLPGASLGGAAYAGRGSPDAASGPLSPAGGFFCRPVPAPAQAARRMLRRRSMSAAAAESRRSRPRVVLDNRVPSWSRTPRRHARRPPARRPRGRGSSCSSCRRGARRADTTSPSGGKPRKSSRACQSAPETDLAPADRAVRVEIDTQRQPRHRLAPRFGQRLSVVEPPQHSCLVPSCSKPP